MTTEIDAGLAAKVAQHIDEDRLVRLVQEVCRIPSILGEEGPLATYLAGVMNDSGFAGVELQPVIGDRPNAIGHLDFGTGDGPNVVLTGHMDTKPVSHGWEVSQPFSGDLIDGSIYGHGIMDMKAALVCQIIAMEALRASGLELDGRVSFAAVSDHMGDQTGAITYFKEHPGDLCVLGELSDNEIFLGHRGRYYYDIIVRGISAHTCHKPLAVNANMLAAHAIIELDQSKLEPQLEEWVTELFGPETYMSPGRVYGGLPPGGPSMIPDECVIRVDCRPQPGVTLEEVRAEIDRCLAKAKEREPRFEAEVVLADVKSGYLAEPEAKVTMLMREAVESVRGEKAELQVAGWLGDTASFGGDIPTIIFGPGGEPVYCPDEHLSIDDIVEATKVYATFAALALTAES
ncbi:M20/M25/M40 family metallo-hydrolase [Demequina capsici]|uniref:M20/M25/M40 family metallo-hydrolase n=1 Tax=Demequina capsici TaxID=3075620 RepID=A0AA96FCI7_9MICO|nr:MULTISPECIES: M20/M25/M40 family metallo-hydrolase [unclassified Demequina]WNM24078.1 M20/M25/M40 family metallo-hydrolase [Demequina sp. OYTSA14]WNM26905.1 M20/M25/M40 family metallo-hydrolase [Demequina sp. PMTSA13]